MRVVVLGAGGQAREAKWMLTECAKSGENFQFIGFVVTDLSKLSDNDSKEDVLGDYSWLLANRSKFDALVVGIGSPTARLSVVGDVESHCPEVLWPTLIHPTVTFDLDTCRIGKGCFLAPGVRLTVNVELGDFALLNQNVTVGHEAKVGSGVVINPGANISGGVVLGDETLVGTGAQVLQYLKVGQKGIIGAGAVVNKHVDANTTVVGVPAKPVRQD